MVNTARTCLRLPEALLERIEAFAKANGIKFSAAARIALQRGVAAIERESQAIEPKTQTASVAQPAAQQQRRRVISKGI